MPLGHHIVANSATLPQYEKCTQISAAGTWCDIQYFAENITQSFLAKNH